MERSDSIKNLATALIKFNSEVGKIHKKSDNPFFKSKYAALPDILSEISEPLQNAGLVIVQMPDGLALTTMLIHGESGEYISTMAVMQLTKTDPQSMGSAITYYRRYSIAAILNLNIDEDDDGNKASKPQQPATKPEPKPVQTPEQIALKEKISAAVVDLERCETLEQVKANWDANPDLQKYKVYIQAKEAMKNKLTPKN